MLSDYPVPNYEREHLLETRTSESLMCPGLQQSESSTAAALSQTGGNDAFIGSHLWSNSHHAAAAAATTTTTIPQFSRSPTARYDDEPPPYSTVVPLNHLAWPYDFSSYISRVPDAHTPELIPIHADRATSGAATRPPHGIPIAFAPHGFLKIHSTSQPFALNHGSLSADGCDVEKSFTRSAKSKKFFFSLKKIKTDKKILLFESLSRREEFIYIFLYAKSLPDAVISR